MYEVIKAFRDSKNNDHLYEVGDTYPVPGYKPTKARIEELVKGKNRFGVAFLKEEAANPGEPQTPDPADGGEPQTPKAEG